MTTQRYLIVNADDFGQSPGINQAIIETHQHGIVTSASLMVRWPAAGEAAAYARTCPELSLGLHLDLGEWAYRDGEWMPLYEVVSLEQPTAVRDEVARQLDRFRRLTERDPTHIDSHQHVHHREPLRAILQETAHRLHVPLRHYTATVRYEGNFYGQTAHGEALPGAITFEHLLAILSALPAGIIEVGCHPGGDDLDTMYRQERIQEARVLQDPRLPEALNSYGIRLCSFQTMPGVGEHPDPVLGEDPRVR